MAETQVAAALTRIRERMAAAATRSGRSVEEITLVAVTKTVAPAHIAEAVAAGTRDFGENYVQEALAKIGQTPLDKPDIRWHFIGHLQSNKARDVVARFALIHSVDSARLAQALGKKAREMGRTVDILLEVKLDAASAEKFGFAPETVLEAAAQIAPIEGVRLRGLMGMAPFSSDPEQARPHFRRLRGLFNQLPAEDRHTLSMGMSGDFEVAIEEGSTLVRIGTAIFGRRETGTQQTA